MNQPNLMSFAFTGPGYRCSPARYSKGKMILNIDSDGSGWKTRGMWLAEALGGKWGRGHEQGYRISPRRAAQWKALYEAGADANVPYFKSETHPVTFEVGGKAGLTLKEALASIK